MNTAYHILLIIQFVLSAVVFISLMFITAPYGKFSRRGWGLTVKSKYAWLIMESPAVIIILVLFLCDKAWTNPASLVFIIIWEFHYLHRTFIYPFLISSKNRPFPIILVLVAIIFNSINGYINGHYLFQQGGIYTASWLRGPAFITGMLIFIAGFIINRQSDSILKNLRNETDDAYAIPRGGLFRFVSCPHYFGEIMEWTGWAVLTWSLPGLAFALFTTANLLPRALKQHRWYREQFGNYPPERKAVIPFLL